jgi:hypothetical protein
MIYTSYFGNFRNFGELQPISIARYPIKNFNGFDIQFDHHFNVLRPSVNLLHRYKNGKVTNAEYAKEYYIQILNCDWDLLFKEYDNSVLLCYEKPKDFCHRHVLSYILRKLGYNIREL